jgi:hypothetical protein
MKLKINKSLLHLITIAAIVYSLHKLVFFLFNLDTTSFQYSLEFLYIQFLGLSILVFKVLLKVKEKSFDNVGMSFLAATSVKMVFCYIILRPLLQVVEHTNKIEKINFFMIFFIFLSIETVLTIRILNEKPQKEEK